MIRNLAVKKSRLLSESEDTRYQDSKLYPGCYVVHDSAGQKLEINILYRRQEIGEHFMKQPESQKVRDWHVMMAGRITSEAPSYDACEKSQFDQLLHGAVDNMSQAHSWLALPRLHEPCNPPLHF